MTHLSLLWKVLRLGRFCGHGNISPSITLKNQKKKKIISGAMKVQRCFQEHIRRHLSVRLSAHPSVCLLGWKDNTVNRGHEGSLLNGLYFLHYTAFIGNGNVFVFSLKFSSWKKTKSIYLHVIYANNHNYSLQPSSPMVVYTTLTIFFKFDNAVFPHQF